MIEAYEFIDIVVRRDSLEKKEKGLSKKFIEEYEVELPHYDDDIICIPGGMNPYDVKLTVEELEQDYGLIFNPNPKELPVTDIVIVEPFGITTRNRWLYMKKVENDKYYERVYYFEEDKQRIFAMKFEIKHCSVLDARADIIVNAANNYLFCGG